LARAFVVYVAAIQAMTTLLIGVLGGYIAWRQWRTSQDRIVLDLFERRFQVFQELTRTIYGAFSKANVQINDLANFDAAREKARYLFGAEVHDYLKQVRPKLIAIHAIEQALPAMPPAVRGDKEPKPN
jgi:hypothetical protein